MPAIKLDSVRKALCVDITSVETFLPLSSTSCAAVPPVAAEQDREVGDLMWPSQQPPAARGSRVPAMHPRSARRPWRPPCRWHTDHTSMTHSSFEGSPLCVVTSSLLRVSFTCGYGVRQCSRRLTVQVRQWWRADYDVHKTIMDGRSLAQRPTLPLDSFRLRA